MPRAAVSSQTRRVGRAAGSRADPRCERRVPAESDRKSPSSDYVRVRAADHSGSAPPAVTWRTMPFLADVSLGFRNAYLDHERLTSQLRAWTEAFPKFCRLQSIAKTPEGRDVWLLVVGIDPDRVRPAVWVGG